MEFHDILHGHIRFSDSGIVPLLADLIDSPEIHRLRNMRQMNFDVPLIQELGRSRRLPHSIGVVHVATQLAHKCHLDSKQTAILVAAAMLHDAAIPPYGHLVESEFKNKAPGFNHETRLEDLVYGKFAEENQYAAIVPGKHLKIFKILDRHGVDARAVLDVVCPPGEGRSPISADIDIDNIDNVHRMAAMLGWEGARENLADIINGTSLQGLGGLEFSEKVVGALERWLYYRQRIYTMIIAHPECVPYNALQADLVRLAVQNDLITPDQWWLTEPEFEERLRRDSRTAHLANQLIAGCDYRLIDYVWFKGFSSPVKTNNAKIVEHFIESVQIPEDQGYFVWNEKGLISRRVSVPGYGWGGGEIGVDSTSCMVALVRKVPDKLKRTKVESNKWRQDVVHAFVKKFEVDSFEIDYPETYNGEFFSCKNNEFKFGYY